MTFQKKITPRNQTAPKPPSPRAVRYRDGMPAPRAQASKQADRQLGARTPGSGGGSSAASCAHRPQLHATASAP